jgi:hypothetical protein
MFLDDVPDIQGRGLRSRLSGRPCCPVASDYYTTMAQILPLLLLALIWDSSFLDRLRGQPRRPRRVDPSGVLFWTKPRVRAYTLFVAVVVLGSTAVSIFELAGFIPDSFTLRVVLACLLGLVLATIMTRIWYDVIAATASPGEPAPATVTASVGETPAARPGAPAGQDGAVQDGQTERHE